jgi:hypothetical protein
VNVVAGGAAAVEEENNSFDNGVTVILDGE